MTTPRLRAVVVDDEPLARRRILTLLRDEEEIEVVGEATSGTSAVKAIDSLKPDLVFLDVQMPGLDGFGVLNAIAARPLPLVIFVTAHDEHAIQAFDVHAVDYVLKPVIEGRFRAAVRRALNRRAASDADALTRQMAALIERMAPVAPDRLAVRSGERTVLLKLDDIDWIDVDGDYARVHAGKETYHLRQPLGDLERRLPSARFARVHRSFIIPVDRIQSVQPWFKGDYAIVLKTGTRIVTGRTYRQRVQSLLKNP